jgi:3-oxoacyl-[acyl-carrier protein] reductase
VDNNVNTIDFLNQTSYSVGPSVEAIGEMSIMTNGFNAEYGRAAGAVINVNLKSAFLCTQAVAQTMMDKRKGRIISIASGAGVGPNPHAPSYLPYGAGKAGLIGFTKLLARDIGQYGVTVNTIAPGTTLTPRVRKVRDAASVERIKERNPMKVLVEPEDTSAAALFLASSEARYITGVNLNVNAGNIIV